MILQFNHLQRKSAVATSQDVIDALYGLLEEGHIEQAQFARMRVHLDWIQYKQNFREPVTIMRAVSEAGEDPSLMDVHVDMRQILPGVLRGKLLEVMQASDPDAPRTEDRLVLALIVIHGHAKSPAQPPASSAAGSGSRPGSAPASPARSAAATEGLARWTAPVPVSPQTLQGSERITGLACATQQVCFAADSGGGVLAQQSAGNWPVAATDPNGGLVAISCASARFCLALDSGGYSIALNQGSWGLPVLVGTGSGTLTSVSCTGPDFCMAVDTIGIGFQYGGAGASWTQLTIDPGGHRLNSVSCASPTDCVAVSSSGAVFTFSGSSWSADPVDRGHDLVSVSCPNVAFCMAVDSSGLAAEFAGGQWTLHPIEPGAAAVSCPSKGTCLASYDSGAVASYTGGRWSSPSMVDSGASINQLSCVAVDSCVATDARDNVLFYAPPNSG